MRLLLTARLLTASLLGAGLLGLVGCSTAPNAYSLMPRTANGVDLSKLPSVKPGVLLESQLPGGVVMVRTVDQFSEYGASFAVAVQKAGGGAAAFGPENLRASAGGQTLHVFSVEELDAEIKETAREVLLAGDRIEDPTVRRDIESASCQMSRAESSNTFGGCPAGEGRCLANSPDFGQGYRMDRLNREENVQTAAEVALKLQAEMPEMRKALRPAQVAPGALGGGLVVVEHPKKGQTVRLEIDFGGQTHSFSAEAQPKT